MPAGGRAYGAKGRNRHKYRAKPITLTGPNGLEVRFASRAEAAYVIGLWLRAREGEISGLELQPKFPIHVTGPRGPVHVGTYTADASFVEVLTNAHHVQDYKPVDTVASRFKRRCVEAEYGVHVEIVKGLSSARVDQLIALWTARSGREAA